VGACGRLEWAGQVIGYLGRLDRKLAEKLSLRELPTIAEIDLLPLLEGAQHVPQLRPLPRFPAVERDLSLVVEEKVRFEQIESLIRKLSLADLEALQYVTTYRGKPLEKGSKSLSVRLVFRSPSTTLTSEQVEGSMQQVIQASQRELGAVLRG
jgi:phenylalanyl-tRNA synthetase beta chain